MSYPVNPPPVEQPRKVNRKGRTALIVAAAVSVLACSGLTFIVVKSVADGVAAVAPTGRPAAVVGSTGGPAPAAPDEPSAPAASRFTLDVEITDRECFGTAGCHVTFRVVPGWSGDLGDTPWLITYELSGVEDGPMVGSIEVVGTTYVDDGEEFAMTPSSKAKLRAKVVRVSRA